MQYVAKRGGDFGISNRELKDGVKFTVLTRSVLASISNRELKAKKGGGQYDGVRNCISNRELKVPSDCLAFRNGDV